MSGTGGTVGDGARSARLRDEILRLSGRSWSLEDGRTAFEAVMSYPQRPGAIEMVLELVAGVLSGTGAGAADDCRRVRIWVDEHGTLHRRTITELPPRRRRRGRAWEIEDTDGPAARRTFDDEAAPTTE